MFYIPQQKFSPWGQFEMVKLSIGIYGKQYNKFLLIMYIYTIQPLEKYMAFF